MKEQVSLDRLAELQKYAQEQCQDPALLTASSVDRPGQIKELARTALGIHPQIGIDDIPQPGRTEVLIVMASIRDILAPNEGVA